MYTLNITSTKNIMTVNEFRDIFFGNYYEQIVFAKESSYY